MNGAALITLWRSKWKILFGLDKMWKVTFGFFETHTGEAGEITFKSQTLSILPGDGRYPTVESCCANLEKVKQSKMYAFQTTGTQKIFSDICKWTDSIRSKRVPDITSESSAHIDEVKKALVRFCVHPLSLGAAASSATIHGLPALQKHYGDVEKLVQEKKAADPKVFEALTVFAWALPSASQSIIQKWRDDRLVEKTEEPKVKKGHSSADVTRAKLAVLFN